MTCWCMQNNHMDVFFTPIYRQFSLRWLFVIALASIPTTHGSRHTRQASYTKHVDRGTQLTRSGDYPWLVLIRATFLNGDYEDDTTSEDDINSDEGNYDYSSSSDFNDLYCSGVLLSPQFILTSARCIANTEYINVEVGRYNSSDISLLCKNCPDDFDYTDTASFDDYEWLEKYKEFQVLPNNYIIHPDYHEYTSDFKNDLAIIPTSNDADDTEKNRQLLEDKFGEEHPIFSITADELSELGITEFPSITKQKPKVLSKMAYISWAQVNSYTEEQPEWSEIPLVSYVEIGRTQQCTTSLHKYDREEYIDKGNFCSVKNSKQVCEGDLGAPLIKADESTTPTVLYGIASHSRCSTDRPAISVFVSLAAHRRWILTNSAPKSTEDRSKALENEDQLTLVEPEIEAVDEENVWTITEDVTLTDTVVHTKLPPKRPAEAASTSIKTSTAKTTTITGPDLITIDSVVVPPVENPDGEESRGTPEISIARNETTDGELPGIKSGSGDERLSMGVLLTAVGITLAVLALAVPVTIYLFRRRRARPDGKKGESERLQDGAT